MDSNDDKRQMLIACAIAAGEAAVDNEGEAGIYPWTQLFAHLSPLIGDSGLAALFRRTVRLVSTQYDWLGPSQASAGADELLAALQAQLASVELALARDTNAALLTTFTKLLSGLIGEALTIRLLHSAWNTPGANANVREQS
ncbi:MAG TPA: hypothetical protein VGE60_12895 [Telluria sp.]